MPLSPGRLARSAALTLLGRAWVACQFQLPPTAPGSAVCAAALWVCLEDCGVPSPGLRAAVCGPATQGGCPLLGLCCEWSQQGLCWPWQCAACCACHCHGGRSGPGVCLKLGSETSTSRHSCHQGQACSPAQVPRAEARCHVGTWQLPAGFLCGPGEGLGEAGRAGQPLGSASLMTEQLQGVGCPWMSDDWPGVVRLGVWMGWLPRQGAPGKQLPESHAALPGGAGTAGPPGPAAEDGRVDAAHQRYWRPASWPSGGVC